MSATMLPVLVGLFLQALLYGFYLATLFHCLRWLVYTDDGWKLRAGSKINKLMLVVTVLLFFLSTINLGLSIRFEISAGNRLVAGVGVYR